MPAGFVETSPIACSGITDCAAGGRYRKQPVLAWTHNGGHTFAIEPLPVGDGTLDTLTCPTTGFCAGLAARAEKDETPVDATFLSTGDGGSTFSDIPILAEDSMALLTCSSKLDCTAVGTKDTLPSTDNAGLAARTTDGGRTWTAGAFPAGFGLTYISGLSCADQLHCSVTGTVQIANFDPPQCGRERIPPMQVQSPAVRSISRFEWQLAKKSESQNAGGSTAYSCTGTIRNYVSDIASSINGGLTWTPDPLPADLPQPMLSDISCPTDNECWVAGGSGSSVLVGTTNGGSTTIHRSVLAYRKEPPTMTMSPSSPLVT